MNCTDEMSVGENKTSCVEVGGERYCGVTTWTPTLSEMGAVYIMISLGALLLIMTVLIALYVRQKGWNICSEVKNVYKKNAMLLSLKKCMIEEDYIKLTTSNEQEPSHPRVMIVYYDKASKKYLLKSEVFNDRNIDKKELGPEDIEAVKEYGNGLCAFGKCPRPCGTMLMILTQIVVPLWYVVFDCFDVLLDGYYFCRMETGGMIDPNITRNNHVDGMILAFAFFGGMKLILVTLCSMKMLQSNKKAKTYLSREIALYGAAFKIVLEDGPEVLLEYFFVDKYATEEKTWFVVAEHIGTTLLYLWSLKSTIKGAHEDLTSKMDKDDRGKRPLTKFTYIFHTLGQAFMSMAMLARVLGMVMQYIDGAIDRECFRVLDGELLQTPFSGHCMSVCDWMVFVFTGASLAFSLIGFLGPLVKVLPIFEEN